MTNSWNGWYNLILVALRTNQTEMTTVVVPRRKKGMALTSRDACGKALEFLIRNMQLLQPTTTTTTTTDNKKEDNGEKRPRTTRKKPKIC
jgi:hypothetical protein